MIRLWLGLVAVEIALTAIVAGQPAAAVAHPDLTGLWDGATGGPVPTAGSESAARLASGQPAEASGPASTRDLVDYMKRQGLAVPFTTYGAERYKNADMAKNPNSHCLPPGPSRALTGPSPFLIVQHDQKTGPDSIKYTVTYTDPVFFTKPGAHL